MFSLYTLLTWQLYPSLCTSFPLCSPHNLSTHTTNPLHPFNSLSWADTAASTIGRLWGSLTPPLPRRFLGLPLAPRKSLAGFLAGSLTGALIVAGFWGLVSPLGADRAMWTLTNGPLDAVADDVTGAAKLLLTGWTGLGLVSLTGGLISGVAEALGASFVFRHTCSSSCHLDFRLGHLLTTGAF